MSNTIIPSAQVYPYNVKRRSGLYYSLHVSNANSNGVTTLNTLTVIPFVVGMPQAFSGLCIASLGTPLSFARMGVYLDNNGKPDILDYDCGQLAISTGGNIDFSFGGNRTYSGLIWLGFVAQSVAGSVVRYSNSFNSMFVNTASPYSNGSGFGYSQTGITGALPSPWGSTLTETLATACSIIWIKTA